MNHVRIYGDPFGDDPAARAARAFLRAAVAAGLRCSLAPGAVAERPVGAGQRAVALSDGVRDYRVGTNLPPGEVGQLLAAAAEVVGALAPVVVFAPAASRDDLMGMAGLEWPSACAVLAADESENTEGLLEKVATALRRVGSAVGFGGVSEPELALWTSLPVPAPADGALVHIGGGEVAHGIDLVLTVWSELLAGSRRPLRLVLSDAEDAAVARIAAELAATGGSWEIVREPLAPRHLADAAMVLLPWRAPLPASMVLAALASARPVAVARWAATAAIVDCPGVCVPIGGRLGCGVEGVTCFAPDTGAVTAAVAEALGGNGAAIGVRARRHARELCAGLPPAASPARLAWAGASRPSVVLEAPFLETSSSAELSIETALAMHRRGKVDLRLVPRLPARGSLAEFRRRAPALAPLLTGSPGHPDLWLSSGWPVRASRPVCGLFALRVDWEYGALPLDLAPHVTDEADLVVVHSDHVAEAVVAAGRSRAQLRVVPHGIGAEIVETAPPDAEIVRWKGGLPAVLFCGGMVWRKGFDTFLRAVLEARAAGAEFAVVVKSIGGDSHYRGFDLRGLVDRFRATPGTPPLRLVDRDLSRSELASLYTACEVLLHPYRGEGFCLPVLEARAAGLPVLATAGGATDALMAGPGAVRIPAVRRELDLPGACFGRPWVLEPNAEAAARLLVETLAELPARRSAARHYAPAVRTAFSWSAAAAEIEDIAAEAAARGHCDGRAPCVSLGERVVALPAAGPRPAPLPTQLAL